MIFHLIFKLLWVILKDLWYIKENMIFWVSFLKLLYLDYSSMLSFCWEAQQQQLDNKEPIIKKTFLLPVNLQ